ncbi:DNA polymerase IV [Uliginosibacterium gangwonense]|uniref:DNA polymerase IV n=1 Tax=Uliginosibacterium gangwonense TaxID=392736 RepID=UPI00035D2AB5|nr:DNA polymerase IV [Uliginosibacterium gangwonense]
MSVPRRIAHLDMDAFFASVELLRYPTLRGQPVVVGGRSVPAPTLMADGSLQCACLRDYVGRGVVTTSTYEARALGVFSGMGIMKSAQLAPDALLLPADFEEYRRLSRLFKAAVTEIAPLIEDRGIDEIYIDLTDIPGETRELAQCIKQSVRATTGLSCSMGICPNKLLAKICSDLEKPDGLTVVGLEDMPTRIWPLAVRKVNGIGPKAEIKLKALGIETIGQLAAAAPQWLVEHFGLHYGTWLHQAAHGQDEREVVTHSDPKSISRETTFEHDLHPRHDRARLSEIFTHLCQRVSEDLARKACTGKTIGIKLRYDDFSTVTRDLSLPSPTRDAAIIRRAAGECLKRVPLERRLRLLGVRVSALQLDSQTDDATAAVQAELPFNT